MVHGHGRVVWAALLALLVAWLPRPALGQGFDADVQAAIKHAEGLLAQLEYQRAREVLEQTAADGRVREVRRSVRAKLYAALGRARAELGDETGMAQAFSDAVAVDPTVTLPRGTSPKILAALERAREEAPPTAPSGPQGRREDPPRASAKPKASATPAPVATPPRPTPAAPPPRSTPTPTPARPPPAPPPPSPPPTAAPGATPSPSPRPVRPIRPREDDDPAQSPAAPLSPSAGAAPAPEPRASAAPAPDASAPPAAAAPTASSPPPTASPSPPAAPPAVAPPADPTLPAPEVPRSPALIHRIVGAVSERARVRIVVEAVAIPRGARIEARMRPAGKRVYEPFLMPWVEPLSGTSRTRTATLAALELTLDEPWYEVYFEARQGKKVVARAGSAEAPILIEPSRVPSMTDAWATDQAAAPPPGAVAAPTPDLGPTQITSTSTAGLAAAPPGDGLTSAQGFLLAGGVLAVALVVVLVVLVATGDDTDDCTAEEGRGCTDVRILPLVRF